MHSFFKQRVAYTTLIQAVWLMLICSPAAALGKDAGNTNAQHQLPLRMLVLSPVYSASTPYGDFDYLARQLSATMTFWQSYPREWDVYHLMDDIKPRTYKAALGPNRKRAEQRLRELLDEKWDVIFWVRYDLPAWAREKLTARINAGRPVIFLGDPSRIQTKDALSKLMDSCKTVSPAQMGATGHDYPTLTRIKTFKALAPAHQFLLMTRDRPFPESTIPQRDEVALLSDFWREIIAKLTGRRLPPSSINTDANPVISASALPVVLAVSSDRPGADYEQPIKLTFQTAVLPVEYQGDNHLLVAVTDYTGRLLWQKRMDANGAQINQSIDYSLVDFGPDVYAYYVTAWLVHGNKTIGQAATTLYHYRPWDMRRQWQWSAWESLYRESSYQAAAMMKLFKDAGINSIGFGYPTTRSLWWAERYGWRKYGELIGGRSLWNAPTITTASDDELRTRVRAQMDAKFKQFGSSWASSALTLASLGEEPGFDTGWGTTYYWKQDTAPPVAQQVFQQFLKERYVNLQAVSKSWQTPLEDWSDAKLMRKYALRGPTFEPSQKLDDVPDGAQDFARYEDSSDFFNWYFKKVAAYATQRLHEINPGAKTFYSLHGPDGVGQIGVAHQHHIYYPKEYQALEAARARLHYQGQPSFSLIWNHFDDQAVVEAGLWSQIANQVTHVDFWLGFPLMFNNDMTHTRASMTLKRFLTRFQPVSNVLAQATVDNQGVALLDGPFLGKRASSKIRSFQSAYTALAEAGFPPAFVDQNTLGNARMIFASGATHLSSELAQKLKHFVEQGGVLITTAGFATRTEHGRLLPVAPAFNLAQWMGFEYGPNLTSSSRGLGKQDEGGPFTTHADTPALDGIEMDTSPYAVKLANLADDVVILGRFKDNTPALVYRKIGKGGVYHMNFLHHEWGWPTLAKQEREALRQIISGIAERSNIKSKFFIECLSPQLPDGHAMPFWSSQLFLGRDGKTRYLVVFNDHRSEPYTGRIHWNQPNVQLDDLIEHKPLKWTSQTSNDAYIDLTLLPGQGTILRLTPAGHTPEPVTVPVKQPDAGEPPVGYTPVIPHGWPSEQPPRRIMSESTFVSQLSSLRNVYEQGRSRSDLSYYLFDANVNNRHAITRDLAEQHWPDYVMALENALQAGNKFLLTGQDMGLDPATGLNVTTHRPAVLEAIAQLGHVKGARWYSSSSDGQRLTLELGDGRLVLDRTNLDSIGFHDATYDAWHAQWWPQVTNAFASQSAESLTGDLDASMLKQWLVGRRLLVPRVTISRFAGRSRLASFTEPLLATRQPKVITLAVPQGCVVESAQMNLRVDAYMGFANGNFEQAKDDLPQGVRVYGKGGIDSEVKHEGKYSLRLEPTHENRKLVAITGLSLGRRNVNLVGKTYRLRLWAKAQKLQGLDFKIRAMKWGMPITWDNDLWINVGTLPGGTYDWKPFEFEVTLPETRSNYVLFHMHATGDTDTKVWIDDMRGGKLPEQIQLSIADKTHDKLTLSLNADHNQKIVSEGLAQLINAYLPHAPVDINGMRIVPLQIDIQGSGMVQLSDPKLILKSSAQ